MAGTDAKNKFSQAEEQAKLAYMAVRSEVMTAKVANADYDATKTENAEFLRTLVTNELTGREWTVVPVTLNESKNKITMTYSNNALRKDGIEDGKPAQDGQIIFEITLNGQEVDLFIDGVSATGGINPTAGFGTVNSKYIDKFGKKVNGYKLKDGTVEDGKWRLFYADNNSVYLLRDSIGNKALTSLSWYQKSTISELGKNLNSKFTSWDLKYSGNKLNPNINEIAALLDTDKWEDYKANYAVWVIGAPTLEMFIASYNSTHTPIQIDCIVEKNTSSGYKVGQNATGESVTSFSTITENLGQTDDIDKAIYCPESGYWWLSSPSANDVGSVVYVAYNNGGCIAYPNWNDSSVAIRPLVRIPISKVGTEIAITDSY